MAKRIVDLIDSSGIAERYNLTPQVVLNWQARREDFPTPMHLPLCRNSRASRLWDVEVIDAWMAEHTVSVSTRTLKTKGA